MTLATVFEAMNGGCHPFPKLAGTVMLLLVLAKKLSANSAACCHLLGGGGKKCICFFEKNMEYRENAFF